MNIKTLLYSFTITTATLCSVSAFSSSSETEPVRCVQSKNALKELESKVYDGKISSSGKETTLRELEVESARLRARLDIFDSFSKIHKQREDFKKKLNPVNPNSFYSKDMNLKNAVQSTQKQIISNYILTSITSSISAVLEKEDFLKTTDEEIINSPEWKAVENSKNKYEKFKILSDGNPYNYIREKCKESEDIKKDDPCANFANIDDRAIISLFSQTNQDMVEDVTNKFFDSYNASQLGNKDNPVDLDEELKNIQKEHITKFVSLDGLNEERTVLISTLLEDSKPGVLDRENLADFYNVSEIKSDAKHLTKSASENGPIVKVEELNKIENDFEKAKGCFAKKAFGITPSKECTDSPSIKNFFSKIGEIGNNDLIKNLDLASDKSLLENSDVKKFNANNQIRGVASNNLKTLDILGSSLSEEEKFNQMKEVCPQLIEPGKKGFEESLWNCSDSMNPSQNKSAMKKRDDIKKQIELANTELEKAREVSNQKYGSLIKYTSTLVKENCASATTAKLMTCSSGGSSLTKLTIGGDSFLTNMDSVQWNLLGRKESEKILGDVNSKCAPLVHKERQSEHAKKQVKKQEDAKKDIGLLSVCNFAKNDLNSLKRRTPTKEQLNFRSSYISSYNPLTKKMEHTKKSGIGTKVLKSAGTSLLNNGLPLYLQNMSFKNNLPYQTDMAIYKKNYMYMMNNPQFWTTSMFSGYGVSSPYNNYASSSYYSFGN